VIFAIESWEYTFVWWRTWIYIAERTKHISNSQLDSLSIKKERFSKVSPIPNSLYRITIKLTFEKYKLKRALAKKITTVSLIVILNSQFSRELTSNSIGSLLNDFSLLITYVWQVYICVTMVDSLQNWLVPFSHVRKFSSESFSSRYLSHMCDNCTCVW